MNIVFISTFKSRCGIATYTRKLAEALATLGHHTFVYNERDIQAHEVDTVHVLGQVRYQHRWRRGAPYASPYGLGAVARSIRAAATKPDVIHVQHEFGLFPRTPDLVQFAKDVGLPVVFTLHTVDADHILGLRALAEVGRAIVHSPEAMALLWDHAVDVIPHGATAPVRPRERPSCLLVPGFVGPGKGTLEIVEAYWRTLRAQPSYPYPLRIAGLCRDPGYEAKILGALARYDLAERVTFDNAFLDDEAALNALNSAAAVVLGGGDFSPYSASGQLHDAVGLGVPVIAKRLPIYQLAGAGILHYDDAEGLSSWMAAVQDGRLMAFLSGRQQLAARDLRWDAVARMTLRVYG